jgi:hypothetical protein
VKRARTKLFVDAAGARRRITYQLPYATIQKGQSFVVRGNRRRIMTFRGTLSRHAERFGKTFSTKRVGNDRVLVRRWY